MKLEYKILWIEDEPNTVTAKKRVIKNYIENEKGFNLVIKEVHSYEEFETNIGFPSLKEYDLLLVDLDLGEDEEGEQSKDGNKIINAIRDEDIYTEIIFYSSQYDALKTKIQEHFVEGIFTSDRGNLETKAKSIIDVTLRKVQDVNNLRGLILAEVAELDRIKENILLLSLVKISDKKLEKYTLKQVKKSYTKNKNKAEKFIEEIETTTYNMLLESKGFIDSNKKAYAVGEVLEQLNITEPINKENFSEPYIQNILGKRNKFAHIEECDGVDDAGNACKVIGDIPFTEAKCIEIRKEIKEYKKILLAIKDQVR